MENLCSDGYRDMKVVVSDKAPSAYARICFPPQVTVGFWTMEYALYFASSREISDSGAVEELAQGID